jgi:hypothetical protein
VDNLLADFEKSQSRSLEFVTLVLTGSFWKYYRPPASTGRTLFGADCGDHSANSAVGFRSRLEDFYAHSEFSGASPMSANRWKAREMEPLNRRWFYQQSEAIFRNRTMQLARKRARSAALMEMELFTPEADPSLTYSYYLQSLSGSGASDFHRLSSLVDEASSFGSMAGAQPASSFVHWSLLGGFRSLTDPERQFLVLKSLLLMGGRGGGVLIDEEEWFSFSLGFRQRVEGFGRIIAQGDLRLKREALYLCPHLWTGPGALWVELMRRTGHGACKVASLDWIERADDARLVIVDPSVIFTQETVQRLLKWAFEGRVVALPRSSLYSEGARAQMEALAGAKESKKRRIEIGANLAGVAYRIHAYGNGQVVLYDIPETDPTADLSGREWEAFLSAMLALAEVQEPCRVSDSRLMLIPLERQDRSVGLFVLNGTLRRVSGDILFANSVTVSDLATEVTSAQRGIVSEPGDRPTAAARRFSLDVPPCGILPLAVDRVGLSDRAENRAADDLGELGLSNALAAAAGELPGLDLSAAPEPGVWN